MENRLPKLRFPEFSGEWEEKKLKDVFSIFNGYAFASKSSETDGVLWVKIADVGIQEMKYNNLSFLPLSFSDKHKKFILKKGDYVVALTRPILNGKLKIAQINDFFNGALLNQRVGRIDSQNCHPFVYSLLQRDELIKSIENNIAGSDPPNLSPNEINSISLKIPSLIEQTKIANFLTEVDKKLTALKQKKSLLEQYKKGIMQQIFSQELRFKDDNGNNFADWEEKKLGDFLFEHKTNSTGKEQVFSVSVHKGLINQVEHLGRVFAAKNTDNYNLVKPGDIVYTKSPTGSFPLGIIKQSKIKQDVIVSPLYGVFTPETEGLGYMLNVYFESPMNVSNYLSSIIQKGAKNTINITNTTFLSKQIKLPISKQEQQKIGLFLLEIDKKISHCQVQIEKTQVWKKGLLQQMFV